MQLPAPNLLCREIIEDSPATIVAKDHLVVSTLPVGDMNQDGIFSDLKLSDLHPKSIAPTLQDEFALPGCLDRLEMKLRFHGLNVPRTSPICQKLEHCGQP